MSLKFDKTILILFELKVSDVMRTDPIVTPPETMMSELRGILQKHRISGAPVVENGELKGIISIEDLIRWLSEGGVDRPISDVMTRNPYCIFSDMPLASVIRKFDETGFGRFPVIERNNNKLVGILTKGNIIEGTLKRLESQYRDEEIRKIRASHIFEDIAADAKEIFLTYEVIGQNFENAGKASTQMKRNLKRLGIHPNIIQRLAVASYEAEMNTALYSNGGTMQFKITPKTIYLTVKDKGPGIEDVERAMQKGYSTAPDWVRELGFGAGMGLANIKECSDTMKLESELGVGTNLMISINVEEENESE